MKGRSSSGLTLSKKEVSMVSEAVELGFGEERKIEGALGRREREKVVWDGHTASKANTMDKFATSSNIDEQIAAIHRAKGLGP